MVQIGKAYFNMLTQVKKLRSLEACYGKDILGRGPAMWHLIKHGLTLSSFKVCHGQFTVLELISY